MGCFFGVLGVGWWRGGGEISFVSIVGTMSIGGITSGLSLIFYTNLTELTVDFRSFENVSK